MSRARLGQAAALPTSSPVCGIATGEGSELESQSGNRDIKDSEDFSVMNCLVRIAGEQRTKVMRSMRG